MGTANLTYEEFSTVLAQIEAVLCPQIHMTFFHLHFLIGRPLLSAACKDLTEEPINRLTRFKRVEQMRQQFWKRWSTDYISELQTSACSLDIDSECHCYVTIANSTEKNRLP